MQQYFEPRPVLALLIVAGCALAGVAIGADTDAIVIALVGGVAAVLTAAGAGRIGADEPAADAGGERQRTADATDILEAVSEPVLVVADNRVYRANKAAHDLLGNHILGEDVRLAIRHPAAAAGLLKNAAREREEPVHLVGLGQRDQRWEMRVHPAGEGVRIVHLVDRTTSYAAERMRVDFVANASHELRTPLASLIGFIETLTEEAGEDPETRTRFLRIMLDEAVRMQRLVDDLMSLSRIEAMKYREPDARIDLHALTTEVHDQIVATEAPRAADLLLELDAVRPVRGDRAQLSQLLHNIIGNAMKYGRKDTPVRIRLTAAEGDMVRLQVADEGDGIAPEHLPRLTERFYRVDSGRSRAGGGTGLGLAIVKHIVEGHRGRLDIASTPGRGTQVTVLLPPAPLSSRRNVNATDGIATNDHRSAPS
ncbi:ATP-binding protein [Stakelama saccharophila]|uniref:histidine kinase n=1 Tax=Stakelama saccharophila TaxID=3075605 RepID=A0ABZ0B6X5_9SPHN|nr:ATP-binding protein [Stakelama sp. W311]WNO53040.1 ATP-binding protein [Stakelama sp. W311]